MRKFNKIVVALDNSPFDRQLIRYFDTFSDLIHPQAIDFVHIDQNLLLPPGFLMKYTEASGALLTKSGSLASVLEEKVKLNFGLRHNSDLHIEVREGTPMQEILRYIKEKNAELLVLGNKKVSEGSGVVAKRIARHADCDILFVPETGRENIHRIMVPVDFSDYSKVALQGAIDLAAQLKHTTITCFHTFDVPLTGHPSISMSYDRLLHDISGFKREALQKYLSEFDTKGVTVNLETAVNEAGNPARQIYAHAVKDDYDLIVIGAKGHSVLERILLGSVTEKLLSLDKEIPVLVLRQ
jgi:nucleotide-binding universal stress UspA family protein